MANFSAGGSEARSESNEPDGVESEAVPESLVSCSAVQDLKAGCCILSTFVSLFGFFEHKI